MRKADIVESISISTGLDRGIIRTIIDEFIEQVKDTVGKEKDSGKMDAVYLRGFGTFFAKKRAAKLARDISRNASVYVPEHYIPAFKPAPDFYDNVSKHTDK